MFLNTSARPCGDDLFDPEAAPRVARPRLAAAHRQPEPDAVAALVPEARLSPAEAHATRALASRLARELRSRSLGFGRQGLVQGLLREFSLSSQEGWR
jgi:RHH-type proline utilization regulon transcriptional repressor/proline dehydrogenase/delta 1-pyrroline-5-carboxylate dehydrogenase